MVINHKFSFVFDDSSTAMLAGMASFFAKSSQNSLLYPLVKSLAATYKADVCSLKAIGRNVIQPLPLQIRKGFGHENICFS